MQFDHESARGVDQRGLLITAVKRRLQIARQCLETQTGQCVARCHRPVARDQDIQIAHRPHRRLRSDAQAERRALQENVAHICIA